MAEPDPSGRLSAEASGLRGGLLAWEERLSATDQPATRYDGFVRELEAAARDQGAHDIAALCLEYLGSHLEAAETRRLSGDDRGSARCLVRAGEPAAAARSYERAGAPPNAARAWEEAGEPERAVRAWEEAASWFSARGDIYREALCRVNGGLGLLDLGEREGEAALGRAMVLLGEEADRAEGAGEMERALSCYHALIHLGRRTGSHENLAEGFVSCIRLMQMADQPFFVLQYFDDFAKASTQLEEHHAAAEVHREASAWCRRRGMLYTDHFLVEAAASFEAAAAGYLAGKGPMELAESALLAALDCHNRRGDVAAVAESYDRLSRLPLSGARGERYGRLYRLASEEAHDAPAPAQSWAFRGYYDHETAYPATWLADVLEDEDVDLLDPVARVVGDPGSWEGVRRRCLLVCLRRARTADWLADESLVQEVVDELGRVRAPVAIAPLIRLLDSIESPATRVDVVEAVKQLPYPESIEVIRRALRDTDEEVREAALAGIRHMAFPRAFPRLIRLFRENESSAVRGRVALTLGRLVSLEQSGSRDALDFLLHALREGPHSGIAGELRAAVAGNASASSLVVIEHHMAAEPPGETRDLLERVISRLEAKRALEALDLMDPGR